MTARVKTPKQTVGVNVTITQTQTSQPTYDPTPNPDQRQSSDDLSCSDLQGSIFWYVWDLLVLYFCIRNNNLYMMFVRRCCTIGGRLV